MSSHPEATPFKPLFGLKVKPKYHQPHNRWANTGGALPAINCGAQPFSLAIRGSTLRLGLITGFGHSLPKCLCLVGIILDLILGKLLLDLQRFLQISGIGPGRWQKKNWQKYSALQISW